MGVFIDGVRIGAECYPNNERILLEPIMTNTVMHTVTLKYEDDIDISLLMFAKKYLDDVDPFSRKTLNMPYVPYSRMDRKITNYMFSLKYFCQFVNQLHFDRVLIADPHSGVTPAMLDRCEELKLTFYLDNVITLENNIDYVFYPDAGALKRYSEILNLPHPVFYGNKKRDLNTGRIINYELVDEPDLLDKNILIIDDLCAKGGTFMMAGRKLKENGAKNVSLYVTHCEPSIFKGELLKTNVIDRIYTTKSLIRDDWCEKIIFVE